VWAWPPYVVSGASRGSDGEEVKALTPPRTIPNVGSERLLQFFHCGINNEVLVHSPCSLCFLASSYGNSLSPPLILKLALLYHLLWLVGVTTVDAPAVRVPTMIISHHRPIAQRQVPPLVMQHHRSGESSSCADACLGLLLDRVACLCLLAAVGHRLLRQ
jgi:hypothetical protein